MPMIKYPGTDTSEPKLTAIAEERAARSFIDSYEATEEEAIGLVLASHFSWDGSAIMRAFASALEDANFHPEAAKVQEWLEGSS